GVVWFRTAENWLGQFQATQFVTLPRNLSMPGHEIAAICTDAQGKVWVGSEAGIASWEYDHFRRCQPTNGETVFIVKAMASSGDGHNGCLWFSTVKGLVWIRHQELNKSPLSSLPGPRAILARRLDRNSHP
ncbi:MAG: two-component regulator propeller domain-containing protein, partial [Verrucomicrobiota bacterium]